MSPAAEIIILSEVRQRKANTIWYHSCVESKIWHKWDLPGGAMDKNPLCNARDTSLPRATVLRSPYTARNSLCSLQLQKACGQQHHHKWKSLSHIQLFATPWTILYSPWGHKKLDMTEWHSLSTHQSGLLILEFIGEPLITISLLLVNKASVTWIVIVAIWF